LFDEDDNFVATTLLDECYARLAETWLGVPVGDLLPGSPKPLFRVDVLRQVAALGLQLPVGTLSLLVQRLDRGRQAPGQAQGVEPVAELAARRNDMAPGHVMWGHDGGRDDLAAARGRPHRLQAADARPPPTPNCSPCRRLDRRPRPGAAGEPGRRAHRALSPISIAGHQGLRSPS
jgi:hypothetical protein